MGFVRKIFIITSKIRIWLFQIWLPASQPGGFSYWAFDQDFWVCVGLSAKMEFVADEAFYFEAILIGPNSWPGPFLRLYIELMGLLLYCSFFFFCEQMYSFKHECLVWEPGDPVSLRDNMGVVSIQAV